MSQIALQSNASGTGTLTFAAPNTNTNRTLTLPDSDGTLLNTASTLALSNIPDSLITPAKLTQKLTLGTAVATTSGASVVFTGIPAWARKINVLFNAVSTTGGSITQLQAGSTTIQTTGYTSSASYIQGLNTCNISTSITSGISTGSGIATNSLSGIITLFNISGNTWIANGILSIGQATGTIYTAGNFTLTGLLDRICLTTVNGTDTFDAGSINIMYEG